MKVVIVLVVLGALAIAGVYFLGGYGKFDPDQQGKAAKAAIKPGMTWQAVLKVPACDSPRYQSISLIKEKDGSYEREGPEVDFNRSTLAKRITNGEAPAGFYFVYRFSQQIAFRVRFDENGKVTDKEDVMTEADLLQTRKK